MSRRWRYPRSRRGIFYQVIKTQAAAAAPPFVPSFQEPSGRNSRPRTTRRGQFYRFVPAAVVAQAPTRVPAITEPAGRNSRPRIVRRGQFYAVPPTVQSPVAYGRTRRSPSLLPRHGRFYPVPSTAVLPGPGPLSPSVQRPTTRRMAAPRRGRFYPVPLVGVAPTPSIALPQMVRARVRPMFVRRGRFWVQPIQQQVVSAPSWVPQVPRTRRPQIGPSRRGEFLPTPLPRATCPGRMVSRRSTALQCRRSRVWGPSWAYVPPVPPTSGTAHAATGQAPTAQGATGTGATATGASGATTTATAATFATATAAPGSMTVPTATGG